MSSSSAAVNSVYSSTVSSESYTELTTSIAGSTTSSQVSVSETQTAVSEGIENNPVLDHLIDSAYNGTCVACHRQITGTDGRQAIARCFWAHAVCAEGARAITNNSHIQDEIALVQSIVERRHQDLAENS